MPFSLHKLVDNFASQTIPSEQRIGISSGKRGRGYRERGNINRGEERTERKYRRCFRTLAVGANSLNTAGYHFFLRRVLKIHVDKSLRQHVELQQSRATRKRSKKD